MIVKKNTFYLSIQLFLQVLIAFIMFAFVSEHYNSSISTFITADSLLYRERAIIFATNNITIFDFMLDYGWNYSGISTLGSLAYFDGTFNDWFIIVLNTLFLILGYIFLKRLISYSTVKQNNYSIFILLLFLYIPFSLIQLNKELIGFTFIILVMYNFYKRKFLFLFLIGLLFGMFRMQYFAIALILILYRKPKLIILITLIHIGLILFIPPYIEAWYIAVGGNVGSYELMHKLEEWSYIPVVGMLVFYFRILLSFGIGLKAPLDIFNNYELIVGYIYYTSVFIMSILAFIYLYHRYKINKYKLQMPRIYYTNNYVLVVFLAISSIPPFLQPRYYLPLVILFIINNICFKQVWRMRSEQKKNISCNSNI